MLDTNYDLGRQAGLKEASDIALVLEEKWRITAIRHREQRRRWFFGWYTDPIADRDAKSIEAAANGIAAIRQVIAERRAVKFVPAESAIDLANEQPEITA